jgi:hypothetical protein
MARFAAAWRTSGAGTTGIPAASLYAVAARGFTLWEVGAWNTTSTAVSIALRRLSTAGTQGTGQTELSLDENTSAAANATAFDTHSVAPSVAGGSFRAAELGALVGSGVIWTFGDRGLWIPSGTANGVGILPLTGTGQILTVYFEWSD